LPALGPEGLDNVQKQSAFARSRWLGGVAFFAGLGWLFVAAQTGGANAFSLAWGGAKWLVIGGAVWYIIAEIDRNLHERKLKKAARAANRAA
jgi:hypothetical protein